MALTVEPYAGTETVDGEHSLTADAARVAQAETVAGTYQCFIDFTNLTSTEVYKWTLYEKTITGASQIVFEESIINGNQLPNKGWVSRAYLLGLGFDMTLVKVSGTARAISWRISKAT